MDLGALTNPTLSGRWAAQSDADASIPTPLSRLVEAMTTRLLEYIEIDGQRQAKGRQVVLVAVGPMNAGKTTLLARIHTPDEYLDDRVSTVGVDIFARHVKVQYGTQSLVVQLLMKDCAGQERFTHLVPAFCRNVHGGFIVFDSTSERSYNEAKVWLTTLRRSSSACICMLIAAKYDLYEARDTEGQPLCAQWMHGRDMQREARELDCIGLRILSAKTAQGVRAAALELAELAYAQAAENESAVLAEDVVALNPPSSSSPDTPRNKGRGCMVYLSRCSCTHAFIRCQTVRRPCRVA
jgi:small GTP-binding protein